MRKTRSFKLGTVPVGGGAPVTVQSMTNTDTRDAAATLAQIRELAAAGCDIIRVAVPDQAAAMALKAVVAGSPIPVIADIHFDYRLAVASMEAGAHGIRINPGNIGEAWKLKEVVHVAVERGVPVRVGVNGGSLEKALLEQYGGATPEALVESALRNCALVEDAGCRAIKVSLKSSSVPDTVKAYRLFAARTDYPLHLGVTEAGTLLGGTVKSAVGIGALLLDGIGDTLRVSLTGPSVDEVNVGIRILEAVGLRTAHPELVSCPTCGRTQIQLLPIVTAVENEIARLKREGMEIHLRKIAIMGCVVNGPGEARDADLGIAGGKNSGVLFKHGKVVRSLKESELLPALLAEIHDAAAPKAK
jgi:(E)-4-hydroxy-3-methylbut-2-enyl-diphosphate synthase